MNATTDQTSADKKACSRKNEDRVHSNRIILTMLGLSAPSSNPTGRATQRLPRRKEQDCTSRHC